MVRVRVPTATTIAVDIGPLDMTRRLPTAGRKRLGIKTICDWCGQSVEDEYFIAGFKVGYNNMIFHEACLDLDSEMAGEG